MTCKYTEHGCGNRANWLAFRDSVIGASESAALMDAHPWLTRFQLWSQKIGLEDPQDATIPMRVGLALENLISEMYQEETNRPVENPGDFTVFVRDETPFIGCTLDRWTLIDGELCPLELKAVAMAKQSEWENGPPEHYGIQLQHQMLVTGASNSSIAVLVGNREFLWCDVPAKPDFQTELVKACTEFWALVKSETPPDVDARDETAKALARLYATPTDETIILGPEFQDIDVRLQEIAVTAKELKEEETLLKNRIKAGMGNAVIGELPDCRYKWATQERKGYTVEPSSSRVLRRLKKGE